MEFAAGLIKLVPDYQERMDHWCKTLSQNVQDVCDSMQKEGVTIESWFKITIEKQDYILWYMRAQSLQQAMEAFQQSTAKIDHFHMKSINKMSDPTGQIFAQPLLDFSADLAQEPV